MLSTFFTEGKGLTLTSAQHLANMAREEAKRIEEKLTATSFVREEWSLLGSENWLPTKVGNDEQALAAFEADLMRVSQMYAWVAWVAEAITTRDQSLAELNNMNLEEYCKKFDIELPIYEPRNKKCEGDIRDAMSTKERAEYLTLEAYASTFGKFIHDKMPFNNARKALAQALAQPYEPRGEGQSCIVVRKSATVDPTLVEQTFETLQAGYRENERSLNAIKGRIKQELSDANQEVNNANKAEIERISNERQKLTQQFIEWQTAETTRISKMKVVVPLSLQSTVDELNAKSAPK